MIDVLNYYLGESFVLNMPVASSQRHFRCRTVKGWERVKSHVRTEKKLFEWIVKHKALDVFYSSAHWLNPVKIKGEVVPGEISSVNDHLLLGHDLVFDVDAERLTVKGFEAARESLLNLMTAVDHINKYSDNRYCLEYVQFTGSKGFRAVYEDKGLCLEKDPFLRSSQVREERKLFIVEHLKKALRKGHKHKRNARTFFDEEVTTNPYCVMRVGGTINTKTGLLATNMTHDDLLSKSAHTIIQEVMITSGFERMTPKELFNDLRQKKLSSAASDQHQQEEGVAKPTPPPTFHSLKDLLMTSTVLGTKDNHVPVIKLSLSSRWRNNLLRVGTDYSLGKILVLEKEGTVYGVSTKCVDQKTMKKILEKSNSQNLKGFNKYHRVNYPLTARIISAVICPFTGKKSVAHEKYHYNKEVLGSGKEKCQLAIIKRK